MKTDNLCNRIESPKVDAHSYSSYFTKVPANLMGKEVF